MVLPNYNERTKELLFGKDSEVIKANRARTAQSLGGTGALRIAAEFIKRQPKHKMCGLVRQHGQTTMQFSMR